MITPGLPALGALVTDEPWWRYPSRCAAGDGIAHLRVWDLTGQQGHLAVVTETGLGASVTNSIREIHHVLAGRYPGPLTLIEHWPAAEAPSGSGEHLDLALVQPGSIEWQRIWPTPAANPAHDALETWMQYHGHVITGTPPARFLPPAQMGEPRPVTSSPGRQITVPGRAPGTSGDVTAADTGIRGLVVHPAMGSIGWSLTHEPTGRCAGWWPDGTREQVLACAAELGSLADWATTDLPGLTTRPVWAAILAHGGWIPTRDPARWYYQDADGDVVPVRIVEPGDDA